MASGSKNLGLVKAIHAGNTAPANTAMIWYNTLTFRHYYHNGTIWVLFGTGGGAGGTPKVTVEMGYTTNVSINGQQNGINFDPTFKISTAPKPVPVPFRVSVDRNGNDGEVELTFTDAAGGMHNMDGVSYTMPANMSEVLFMFETTQANPVGVYTLEVNCVLGSYSFSRELTIEII